MTVIANSPFPVYLDTDGSALEDGYLYIGSPNQNPETNPITVYWDADYTTPAAQPIRTSGGYAVRNGSPAMMYVSALDYSITVRDKNRRLVYSKLTSDSADALAASLAVDDVFTGNGSTTSYTLSKIPSGQASLKVSVSGVTQTPGTDYTLTNGTQILVFSSPPPNGAIILVKYGQANEALEQITYNVDPQVATAGQTVFNLANAYTPGANTLSVYLNGLRLTKNADYLETSTTSITLTAGAIAGDELLFVTGSTDINPISSNAAYVAYTPAGSGAVATSVQDKLRESVSVKDFGAVGNGVADDTGAIQAAINYASARMCKTFVPEGDYRITASLNLPANCHLVGESRNGSVLLASGKTFPVVNINGSQVKVSGLYIRGGSVGVNTASNAAFHSQVTDCRISYNRIGVELIDTYIFLLKDNYISFNDWGVVAGAQSFQLVVRDNIIDNNLGGGGFLCVANGGTLIVGNTIEGNRKESYPGGPSTGFGLWVVGLNQRTIVRDNWFEQNGNQSGSSDLIISRPAETWVDDLVTNCVPTEHQSNFVSGANITGQVCVEGNFFYATQRGISVKLTGSNYGSISIDNSTFVGIKSKNNRSIELYGSGSAALSISQNNVTNTGDITINTEMLSGIKNSYVFHSGTVPPFERVLLDGKDLFTAYLSTRQFAALTGASLDATSRFPSSGTSQLKNGAVVAVDGVAGARIVNGTGRPRAGSAAWFSTLSVPYYVVVLASGSSAGFTCSTAAGFSFRGASNIDGTFQIHSVTPTAAEAALHTGDYYGWAIIPEADFNLSSLKGCLRVNIVDLKAVEKEMFNSTIPSSFSGSTTYIWNVGDKVYQSTPAAGGFAGWICTTAGSPGTWKTFGAISA